ncbi:hypothetical protein LguiB_009126 [Lonicera macranthoides]
MSQDYHHHNQGVFSTFSNGGIDIRSQQDHQHHVGHQIRRDKVRLQGFEPPLVAIDEEVSGGGGSFSMLSEMFNFPPGGSAAELLESQISPMNYRSTPWYGNINGQDQPPKSIPISNSINPDSSAAAAAMQLFLMNPTQQQRSQSPPSPHQHPSSTLHMLLPGQPSSNSSVLHQDFDHVVDPAAQFAWINQGHGHGHEGRGLSLSLSSSLEAAKAEELRIGDENSDMLYFNNQGGGGNNNFSMNKNLGGGHLQGVGVGLGQAHNLVQVGFGSSSMGVVNVLRNSKYGKAAQELLEEFCSVGRGQFFKNKHNKLSRLNSTTTSNPNTSNSAAAGGSSSSTRDQPPLSAADRIEHQRRKVDRRYNHYCEQMQMVVNSFDLVMGFGAAVPYTALAQKAMSRHFRCLKDAITAQIKTSCELLGEKDAGTSGFTKGETPRLKLLEQSLRQQRAFHQMGMMEQEAWRPQRGLPERSVNILRAWLFEHFLHPYVSNWFINARVRLWKPMVEEMYQQESKEEEEQEEDEEREREDYNNNNNNNNSSGVAQTPMLTIPAAASSSTATNYTPPGKRSEFNAPDNDPSIFAINAHRFSENQAKFPYSTATTTMAPPLNQSFQATYSSSATTTTSGNVDSGSTLIRFGTTAGDVSLTLGLRHAGNLPDKSKTTTPFSDDDVVRVNGKRSRVSNDGIPSKNKMKKKLSDLSVVLLVGFLDPLPTKVLPVSLETQPTANVNGISIEGGSEGCKQFWKDGDFEGTTGGDWDMFTGKQLQVDVQREGTIPPIRLKVHLGTT